MNFHFWLRYCFVTLDIFWYLLWIFAFLRKRNETMSITPTIFHLKILMVRLTTQEYYNTQRHEHTSCENTCTQMNIKQFLQPNTHASWCEEEHGFWSASLAECFPCGPTVKTSQRSHWLVIVGMFATHTHTLLCSVFPWDLSVSMSRMTYTSFCTLIWNNTLSYYVS